MLNISSSSENVRAYGFAGTAPSAFHATECGSGQMQLLIINLDALENATVVLPQHVDERTSNAQPKATSSYAAWVLTPPPATGGKSMSMAFADPFATDVLLNGQLLPDTVSIAMNGGSRKTSGFLEHIPVRPQTGQATIKLPPISITFLCSSD